jgi:double-strand break repair protein MRE11
MVGFTESVAGTFRITQPGSSVATSLIAGEAVRKCVGILDVRGQAFRLQKVPLTQVRPFVTTEITLQHYQNQRQPLRGHYLDPEDPRVEDKMQVLLEEEVQLLCLNARQQREELLRDALVAGNTVDPSKLQFPIQQPDQVLVRLRVEHSGFDTLHGQRFGARFVSQVANPSNILLFFRRRASHIANDKQTAANQRKLRQALAQPLVSNDSERINMEDIVRQFLNLPEQSMKLLAENDLSVTLEEFVEKNLPTTILSEQAAEQLEHKQHLLITGEHKVDKASVLREQIDQEAKSQATAASSSVPVDNGDSQTNSKASKKRGRNETVKAVDLDDDAESNCADDDVPLTSSRARGRSRATTAHHASLPQKCTRVASRALPDSDEDNAVKRPASKASQPPAPSRRTPQRQAAKRKIQYTVDSDDDIQDDDLDDFRKPDDDDILDDDDDEEIVDVAPPPPRSRKRAAQSRVAAPKTRRSNGRSKIPRSVLDSDDDDEPQRVGSSIELDDDWGSAATRSQR